MHESEKYLIIKRGTIFSGKYHIFPKIENLMISDYNLKDARRSRDVNLLDISGNSQESFRQTDLIYGRSPNETKVLSHGLSFGSIPILNNFDEWIEDKVLKKMI